MLLHARCYRSGVVTSIYGATWLGNQSYSKIQANNLRDNQMGITSFSMCSSTRLKNVVRTTEVSLVQSKNLLITINEENFIALSKYKYYTSGAIAVAWHYCQQWYSYLRITANCPSNSILMQVCKFLTSEPDAWLALIQHQFPVFRQATITYYRILRSVTTHNVESLPREGGFLLHIVSLLIQRKFVERVAVVRQST